MTAVLDWSGLLSWGGGWGVLGALAGVAVALATIRWISSRARPGRPSCSACGHLLAAVGHHRCGECGASLERDSSIRWDARVGALRRAGGITIALWLIAIVAVSGGLIGTPIGERIIEARRPGPISIDEWALRAADAYSGDRYLSMLSSWARLRRGREEEIVDSLLRHLPPEGLAGRPQVDHAAAGELVSRLLANEEAAGKQAPSPRLVELIQRLIGEPRLRLRHRRLPTEEIRIATPPNLIANDLRTDHLVERVTYAGETIPALEHRIVTGSSSAWITVPPRSSRGPDTLRVEWNAELVEFMRRTVRRLVQPGERVAHVVAARRIVDERTIEFVAPGEPLVLPTRDSTLRPWGDPAIPWRFELRQVGRQQLVHLHGWLRDRPDRVVCGRWFVEQGDHRVAIGAPYSSAGSGHGDVKPFSRSTLLSTPLDPDGPLTIRFEPRLSAIDARAEYDLYWDEPLKFEIGATHRVRRDVPKGSARWLGFEPQ